MCIGRFAACGGLAFLLLTGGLCAAAEAPLADAAEAGHVTAIRSLLEKKAEVNAPQVDGMTALHWATHNDDLATAKLLIAAGADAKAVNRYQVTPLALACTNGNTALVEVLLEAGADPNAVLPGGETALMTASRTGRIGPVKALLARGAKVDAVEHKSQSALMWAAAEGHLEVVEALLAAGADVRASLPSGFSSLFFAIREGRMNVALRLLEAGLDVNEPTRPDRRGGGRRRVTNPLLLALENGHFELAAALLDKGADPNQKPSGFAPLHAITWVRKPIRGDGDPPPIGSGTMNSLELVRQLAAHGANLDVRLERGQSAVGRFTTTGSTPFVMAARASDVPLLKVLVELGADTKLGNGDDCTPLLAAAGVGALENGDETAGTEDEVIDTIRYLLELGADINAVDKNGETAMHGASYQDFPKLTKYLADRGADINVWNQKNKSGWTPLIIAYGYRPGNFRPQPDTIAALEKVMRAAGVTPPPKPTLVKDPKQY